MKSTEQIDMNAFTEARKACFKMPNKNDQIKLAIGLNVLS